MTESRANFEAAKPIDLVQEVLDHNAAKVRKRANGEAKKFLTIKVDPEVVSRFKKGGEGWQERMHDALRKAVGL